MIAILDACAMVAYLNDERGADIVENILLDATYHCYAHSVNLCEVHYHMARRSGEDVAREGINTLFADGVIERSDMSRAFWERVASHKARGKISIADCFCVALAQELSGQVVTSDHGEFDPIVPLGICPILFIR